MELISTLIYSFAFVFIIVLIILILLNKRNKTTILFSLTLISLLGWVFTLFLFYRISSPSQVLFLGRLNFVFGVVLAPNIYLFVNNFPRPRKNTLVDNFIIVETVILSILALFTSFIVQAEIIDGSDRITEYGPGYFLFLIHFVLLLLSSVYIMVRKVRTSKGIEKVQNQIFLTSLVLALVFGISTNIIVPILFSAGIVTDVTTYTLIQNLGVLSTVFFGIPVFISISRYKFLDVRILIGQLLYYFALATVLYFGFYIVIFIENLLYGSIYVIGAYISGILISVVFAIFLKRVDNILVKNIEISFVNSDYEPAVVLSEFNKTVSSLLELNSISDLTYNSINTVFGVQNISMLLKNENGIFFDVMNESEINWSKQALFLLEVQNLWGTNTAPIVLDQFDVSFPEEYEKVRKSIHKIIRISNELDIRVIVPLGSGIDLLGMLVLGNKNSFNPYSKRDIDFLSSISDTLTLSIKRSFLHEEVQNFNQTLQTKVDEATKELKVRYEELRQIRAKERDMMDIIGHELRTPISIIRISLGSFDLKATKKPETFTLEEYRKVSDKIHDAIERETKLLETMLLSTKIDAERLELTYQELDLNKVIEDALLGHQEEIENKNIKIEFHNGDTEHKVYADKARFSEVVDNLVSNGIKYTDKGRVDVYVDDAGNDMYKVIVADTGIGIPEKAIARLGEKFFRVNQYVNGDFSENASNVVRPGGTGLGLYVTFGLIKAMGGEVEIQSEVGKGSVFSFTVPKYVGQTTVEGQPKRRNVFERMALDKAKVEAKKIGNKEVEDSASNKSLITAEVESKSLGKKLNEPADKSTVKAVSKKTVSKK